MACSISPRLSREPTTNFVALVSLQSVREFFATRNLDIPIIEPEVSTATVALAAEAWVDVGVLTSAA
jgi:hypothetical protein